MSPQRRSTDRPESRRERRLVTFLATLASVSVAVAFATAGFALWQSSSRTTQIQAERARNILRACEETNARHDATVVQLRALVDAVPPGPRKTRAQQSLEGTIKLIDALAPAHKDKRGRDTCPALVRQQVQIAR